MITDENHNIALITVVVPVYNVEKYVGACLESIIEQTYKNLEILVVDDGATDNSGNICDEYAEKDARIRVIHQANSGLSGARNRGIDEAKGSYITFVDSDDVISPFFIEYLYKGIKGCSISVCDFAAVDEDYCLSDKEVEITGDLAIVKMSNVDAIKEVYSDKFHGMDFIACSKLYLIDIFKKNSIRFPLGKLHEDTFTTYKLMYYSDKITLIDAPLYYYRQRKGSITKSSFDERRLSSIEATRGECEFFMEHNEKDLMILSFYDHLHKMKNLLKEMIDDEKDHDNAIRQLCNDMKKDMKRYSQLIKIPIKKQVRYCLMARIPVLSRI